MVNVLFKLFDHLAIEREAIFWRVKKQFFWNSTTSKDMSTGDDKGINAWAEFKDSNGANSINAHVNC